MRDRRRKRNGRAQRERERQSRRLMWADKERSV